MNSEAPQINPLFFNEPVVITTSEHGSSRFKPEKNYAFASGANSIPLTLTEFESAASSYPIVFTNTDVPTAIAVTGLKNHHNLFVDSHGNWDKRSYVPAYVRKYPFLFMESLDGSQFTLCIEKNSLVDGDEGQPIFENEEPSALLSRSLEFCKSFHAAWDGTKTFVSMMQDLDLLIDRRADIESATGERFSLDGFCVIDREKYEALPKSAVDKLPGTFVAAINSHFVSMSCWRNLLSLNAEFDREGQTVG